MFSIGDLVMTEGGMFVGVVIRRTPYGLQVWWNDGDITDEKEGEDLVTVTPETEIFAFFS